MRSDGLGVDGYLYVRSGMWGWNLLIIFNFSGKKKKWVGGNELFEAPLETIRTCVSSPWFLLHMMVGLNFKLCFFYLFI